MIVTEAEGRFVTQRQDPRLAIIATQLPDSAFAADSGDEAESAAALTLTAPDMDPMQVGKTSASGRTRNMLNIATGHHSQTQKQP